MEDLFSLDTLETSRATVQMSEDAVGWVNWAEWVKATPRNMPTLENENLQRAAQKIFSDVGLYFHNSLPFEALLDGVSVIVEKITGSQGLTAYCYNSECEEIYVTNELGPTRTYQAASWKIGEGSTLADYCAHTRKHYTTDLNTVKAMFPMGMGYTCDTIEGNVAVMCLPVVSGERLICLFETFKTTEMKPYTQEQVVIAATLCKWMGDAVGKFQQRLTLLRQKSVHHEMVMIVRALLRNKLTPDDTLSRMVIATKRILKAQSATLYKMIELGKDLAYIYEEVQTEGETVMIKRRTLLKISPAETLLYRVLKTTEPKLLSGRAEIKRDSPEDDGADTLMFFPIIAVRETTSVQGIVKLVNKTDCQEFNEEDLSLIKSCVNYLGVAIDCISADHQKNKAWKMLKKKEHTLMVNMKPCEHQLNVIRRKSAERSDNNFVPRNLYKFDWDPRYESSSRLVLLTIEIFRRVLGTSFAKQYDLPLFVTTVSRSYRHNPYHNFEHAFNVTHCMANILIRNMNNFSKLEIISLMVACLCHDGDHPGRTNTFLWVTSHKLTQLYSSSTLENHHYYIATLIIKECHLLEHLSETQYRWVMREIYDLIIFTDLSLYFKNSIQIAELIATNSFSWQKLRHRTFLKGIMMTTCDLSGQFKNFDYSSMITSNLLEEFYSQGDEERSMGLIPMDTMDRRKWSRVPKDQINFMTLVCIPCADILSTILKNTRKLYDLGRKLRDTWEEVNWEQETSGKYWHATSLLSPYRTSGEE